MIRIALFVKAQCSRSRKQHYIVLCLKWRKHPNIQQQLMTEKEKAHIYGQTLVMALLEYLLLNIY